MEELGSILERVKQVWATQRATLPKSGRGEDDSRLVSAVSRLLHTEDVFLETHHEFLGKLLETRDLLEPIYKACLEKQKTISMTQGIRVGTLHGLARRLGPTTRPPPEYNDPSGADALCVPGYVFPCPDQEKMLLSTLSASGHGDGRVRCAPPEVTTAVQTGYGTAYDVILKCETSDAEICFAIGDGLMRRYNPRQMPSLSAPGSYTIHAYALKAGFLPSEKVVRTLVLEKEERAEKGVTSGPSKAAAGTAEVSETAFGGLFVSHDAEEEDDDYYDEDEEGE